MRITGLRWIFQKFFDIVTGGEDAALACDHDGAYGLVVGSGCQPVRQRLVHRAGDGVFFVRAIEGECGDAIGDVEFYGHFFLCLFYEFAAMVIGI
jgi:hypothetical protein